MLSEVIDASNETLFVNDEQYVLVVDLFIFRPELELQVWQVNTEHQSLQKWSDQNFNQKWLWDIAIFCLPPPTHKL